MNTTTFLETIAFCFFAFFWVSWKASRQNGEKLFAENAGIGNLQAMNYKHASGIILFGIVPFALLPFPAVLLPILSARSMEKLVAFCMLLTLTALCAAKLAERKKRGVIFVPGERNISISTFVAYLSLRVLFLISYEIFFRGFLLFGCTSWLGTAPAIIINVLLYMLMHAFSEKAEILACIPFGLALCWMSLGFNSVWPAIILHLVLSLVYEIRLFGYYLLSYKTAKL